MSQVKLHQRRDNFVRTVAVVILCIWPSFASATEWKEEKGDHFIVYYANDQAQPKEVIRKSETYYNRIADSLGYARRDNFWQWDNRVKIYIHPTREAFQKDTGQPAWSHGMASYFEKELHFIQGTDGLLDEILPHEITHLIFRDFVGFKGKVPLWMDEGVAQWQEEGKRREALQAMPTIVTLGYAMSLKRLMMTDIRSEQDPKRVSAFYAQAVSLIDFLIGNHGASSFTVFCRELRDGKTLDAALRGAYSSSISSVDELETKWIRHVMDAQKINA